MSAASCRCRGLLSMMLFAWGFVLLPHTAMAQLRVIDAAGPPVWGANIRLVEELRIGSVSGAPEFTFGNVDGVSVAPDGTIYVADGRVPIVRAYDPAGRFIRNFGKKGQGPGEYGWVNAIGTLPDGRVAVWDMNNQRATLYHPDARVAATLRVPANLLSSDIFRVDQQGRLNVRTVLSSSPRNRTDGWIRVSPTGQVIDTLRVPPERPSSELFVLSNPSGYDYPFIIQTVTTVSPLGYMISGRNDRYSFDLLRPGGDTVRIQRPFQPLRLGRDERTEWLAWSKHFELRAANPLAGMPAGARTTMPTNAKFPIPETKPAYSELRVDSQGRIWVHRYVAAVSRPGEQRERGDTRPRRVWREPVTFDVFEPDGTFLGSVVMPWDARFYDAKDRTIWATVTGRFDEEYVVRYRIDTGN